MHAPGGRARIPTGHGISSRSQRAAGLVWPASHRHLSVAGRGRKFITCPRRCSFLPLSGPATPAPAGSVPQRRPFRTGGQAPPGPVAGSPGARDAV